MYVLTLTANIFTAATYRTNIYNKNGGTHQGFWVMQILIFLIVTIEN